MKQTTVASVEEKSERKQKVAMGCSREGWVAGKFVKGDSMICGGSWASTQRNISQDTIKTSIYWCSSQHYLQ
jgi:hypothetical protein